MIPHLRSLLAAASLDWDESKRGPGEMGADATADGGAVLWHSDGDLAATIHPHPLIDPASLASLIAAAVSALPALIEVAEAAETYRREESTFAVHGVSNPEGRTARVRMTAALNRMDAALAALAKLEAP